MDSMILTAVMKYIGATAVLLLFYLVLFRGKSSFGESRIYLLVLPFAALLLTQFSIVVYTPEARIVERTVAALHAGTAPEFADFETGAETDGNIAEPTAAGSGAVDNVGLLPVLVICYMVVTASLLIVLLIGICRVIRLKRRSEIIHFDGYDMVVSEKISSPFSFWRSIYIGNGLSDEKLEIVINHEKWHILHRHYIDLAIMEILSRIMWFNPFMWYIRREIRDIHEFQADRSVIDEGQDIFRYQAAILEEMAGKIPYAANAFNNSFTKKRFLMMKNVVTVRHRYLRRAAVLPIFALVLALFSFTKGETETIYVDKPADVEHDSVARTLSAVGQIQPFDAAGMPELSELPALPELAALPALPDMSGLSMIQDSLMNIRTGLLQMRDSLIRCKQIEIAALRDSLMNIRMDFINNMGR